MHYCLYLYTKEFPSDEVIDQLLKPYNEESYYKDDEEEPSTPRPLFLWDFWQVGGRYGGKLRLSTKAEDDDRYDWEYCPRHLRAGKLYRCRLIEKCARGILDPPHLLREEEALQYLHMDDSIRVDGGWLPHIVNRHEIADRCFIILTDDGTAIAREVWDGDNWIDTPDFDDRARLVMERCEADHFLTVIDIHD